MADDVPKGAFIILPEEYIEYSRVFPRALFTMLPSGLSHRFDKAHPPSADLRYREKDSISHSKLVIAAIKG